MVDAISDASGIARSMKAVLLFPYMAYVRRRNIADAVVNG